MPTEHAGGAVPEGMFRVPVEWSDEKATAIAIESFNYDPLDQLEDEVRERIRLGQPLGPYMEGVAREFMEREREEILVKVISLIVGCKKPGLRAVQIAFAAGLYFTSEISGSELAKQFGISKEAFQQGVEKVRSELGLRQTRTMRGAAARDAMRRSNYRRGGG